MKETAFIAFVLFPIGLVGYFIIAGIAVALVPGRRVKIGLALATFLLPAAWLLHAWHGTPRPVDPTVDRRVPDSQWRNHTAYTAFCKSRERQVHRVVPAARRGRGLLVTIGPNAPHVTAEEVTGWIQAQQDLAKVAAPAAKARYELRIGEEGQRQPAPDFGLWLSSASVRVLDRRDGGVLAQDTVYFLGSRSGEAGCYSAQEQVTELLVETLGLARPPAPQPEQLMLGTGAPYYQRHPASAPR